MKKKYLSYLILATILILVSCTGSITTTDTDTKTLNGACTYTTYKSGVEQTGASATCKDAGTTLTITFNPAADLDSTKKVQEILIDSNKKSVTITFEDNSTQTNESSPGAAITMTTKPDSWEVFINDRLFAKVIAN